MLDRVSVSIALTTIIAVLGKAAFLYKDAHETWFTTIVDGDVLYVVLITIFMVFFRGKMMHDDSAFFTDLERGEKFKGDNNAKARIKAGLLTGYMSWLCWGPAIYFLEIPRDVAWWLLMSLFFSSLWLLADIVTRKLPDSDPEAKRRPIFLFVNLLYAVPLVLMANKVILADIAAGILVVVLLWDWILSDPLGPLTQR
jgi:hypothetical protein